MEGGSGTAGQGKVRPQGPDRVAGEDPGWKAYPYWLGLPLHTGSEGMLGTSPRWQGRGEQAGLCQGQHWVPWGGWGLAGNAPQRLECERSSRAPLLEGPTETGGKLWPIESQPAQVPMASWRGGRVLWAWLTLVAVKTMMCWTSLQVRQGRTCSMRAISPAAKGAAAEVPVCPSVQPVPLCKSQSVVACRETGAG